jgi:hypothetical protein
MMVLYLHRYVPLFMSVTFALKHTGPDRHSGMGQVRYMSNTHVYDEAK